MDLRLAELSAIEEQCGFGGAIAVSDSWSLFRHYVTWTTYVSFSNVTVADLGLSAVEDSGVTEREVIFPLEKNKQDPLQSLWFRLTRS